MLDASIGGVRITGDLNRVLRHAYLPFMRAIRNSIKDEIQRTAPVGATGQLRDQSYVDLDERTGNISAGSRVHYAAAVHDGHVTRNGGFVEGRPFIRNAVIKFTHGRVR